MNTSKEKLILCDAHVHLQDDRFAGKADEVIQRANDAGIEEMVCNGCLESDWKAVQQLAEKYKQIVPCFGVHPWYVDQLSDGWLERLEDQLKTIPSGVGEIGLDKWFKDASIEKQVEVFKAQLRLARKLNRPIVIHCLKAWGLLLDVLQEEAPLPSGMMIHAFSGSEQIVNQLCEMGAYFSFGGSVLSENNKKARKALLAVPTEKLLIETDSPDILPPKEYREHEMSGKDGKILNEPANLSKIVHGIAQILGVTANQLATVSSNNLKSLFKDIIKAH